MSIPFRERARYSARCISPKAAAAVLLLLLPRGTLIGAARPGATVAGFVPQQSIEQIAARAEQLESDGNWEEAEGAYKAILKIDPRSVAALNRLGTIEVRRGQFASGISYYKRALSVDPSEFATNLNLGIAYVKTQDYRSAVPPLERATLAAPENFQARELLGAALIGQNDFSHAVPELQKAFELNPNDLDTLYLLERSYLETEQFEKALPVFERLESLNPNSAWVRILRGQAEDALGNYQKAIDEFEVARQLTPGDATVRFSLGFMYWKMHRLGEAESEIKEALKLDPDFEEAKYYLADAYVLEEKPTAALPLLEALLRRQPRDARALADKGKALDQLNRDIEAARTYESCLLVEPERADIHYRLARVYTKLKRRDDSVRELATAQRLQRMKREKQESLMEASGAHGDPTRLEEVQKRALRSDEKTR